MEIHAFRAILDGAKTDADLAGVDTKKEFSAFLNIEGLEKGDLRSIVARVKELSTSEGEELQALFDRRFALDSLHPEVRGGMIRAANALGINDHRDLAYRLSPLLEFANTAEEAILITKAGHHLTSEAIERVANADSELPLDAIQLSALLHQAEGKTAEEIDALVGGILLSTSKTLYSDVGFDGDTLERLEEAERTVPLLDKDEFREKWKEKFIQLNSSRYLKGYTYPNSETILKEIRMEKVEPYLDQLAFLTQAVREEVANILGDLLDCENHVKALADHKALPESALIELALAKTTSQPQLFANEWVSQYNKLNSGYSGYLKTSYPTQESVEETLKKKSMG